MVSSSSLVDWSSSFVVSSSSFVGLELLVRRLELLDGRLQLLVRGLEVAPRLLELRVQRAVPRDVGERHRDPAGGRLPGDERRHLHVEVPALAAGRRPVDVLGERRRSVCTWSISDRNSTGRYETSSSLERPPYVAPPQAEHRRGPRG
jgi:hypothetical protein